MIGLYPVEQNNESCELRLKLDRDYNLEIGPTDQREINTNSVFVGLLEMKSDILVFDLRTVFKIFLRRLQVLTSARSLTKNYFLAICDTDTMPVDDRQKYLRRMRDYVDIPKKILLENLKEEILTAISKMT